MAESKKGVQVNATIPPEWDQKLEDHRWSVRKTKTQLVKTYVERGMIADGLLPDPESGQTIADKNRIAFQEGQNIDIRRSGDETA